MLILATEIWKSHGGVQRYMDMIARIVGLQNHRVAIVTLLDNESSRPPGDSTAQVICCAGSKARFCVEAFRTAARNRPRITIVGHVGLLPVAWSMKLRGLIEDYVVVLHGTEAWIKLPWFSRLGARAATSIVATTRYTLDEFCYYNGVSNAACTIIPLASTLPPPPASRPRHSCELRLLTVTRLSAADKYKGIDTLLNAIHLSQTSGVRVTLDIVGWGDDAERLKSLASSLGIQKAVHFRGAVSDETLQQLFSESDVFAMPSKKEGFGIVFVEAMAAGLPCIGANHGGVPDVIKHGETGFLIEYGDAEQLCFYIRSISESPALYNIMSEAAKRHVSENLSFAAMSRSWQHLLTSLKAEKLPSGLHACAE